MTARDVKSMLVIAVFIGLVTYFTIDKELKYEKARLEATNDCQPKPK